MRQRITRGFTLVEMMVVVAVIAVLIALLIPTLKNVKEAAGETNCASNLKQLGAATISYLAAYNDNLPQVAAQNPYTGQLEIIGALFGGKRGSLAMFGIDQYGADKRPLNKFLGSGSYLVDTDPTNGNDEDVPVFHCPLDRGQPAQPGIMPPVDSMYDFIGSSYTLNDHALDSEDCWTLVPKRSPACDPDPSNPNDQKPGGKMTHVESPSKTWMLGDLPIYNYQEGGDRHQYWHYDSVQVNLCFVDGHVGSGIKVAKGIVNTTKQYTFLPGTDWLTPESKAQHCNCP